MWFYNFGLNLQSGITVCEMGTDRWVNSVENKRSDDALYIENIHFFLIR